MFFSLFILIPFALFFILSIGVIVWVYKDAKQHGQSPLLWLLICLVSTPLLGLILYLAIGRQHTQVACPACGWAMPQNSRYCPSCGAAVPLDMQALPPAKKTSPGVIIGVVAAVLAAFILLVIAPMLYMMAA